MDEGRPSSVFLIKDGMKNVILPFNFSQKNWLTYFFYKVPIYIANFLRLMP